MVRHRDSTFLMVIGLVYKAEIGVDDDQCVEAIFDIVSQCTSLSFINHKCVVYRSSNETSLCILTHIALRDKKLFMGSLNSAYMSLFAHEVVEYDDAIHKDNDWAIILSIPDSRTCTVSSYMLPYKLSTDEITTPGNLISAISRHHNDTQTSVSLTECRSTMDITTTIAFELSNSAFHDNKNAIAIISIIKHIARELSLGICLSMLEERYPLLPVKKGTIVDVGCMLRDLDPQLFTRIRNGIASNAIRMLEANSKTPYDHVATLVYMYVFPNLVCTDVASGTFYVFSDGWHKEPCGAYLHRLMADEILYNATGKETGRPAMMIKTLMSKASRDTVIRCLAIKAESRSFMSMLNSKINIIGLSNCVYDTIAEEFRAQKPCDYCMMNTGINVLLSEIVQDNCAEVVSLLKKVFVDEDVLRFWFTVTSMSLAGKNLEKIVPVWIGNTDSGKSTCQRLIEATLGDYSGVAPTSMITDRKPPSHGTTSALNSMSNKFIIFMQEPEDYKVNSAQLKSLSGNDRLYSREIYETWKYIDLNTLIIIVSNGTLDLSRCDEAALSRMVVIPFLSTFITSRMAHKYDTNISSERVFAADKDLDSRFHILAPHFFYLLTLFYNRYKEEKLIIPPIIRQYTDDYIMRCNPMVQFINIHITRSPDNMVTVFRTYEVYKEWLRNTSPSSKIPDLRAFVEGMRSNGYEAANNFFCGITLTGATR